MNLKQIVWDTSMSLQDKLTLLMTEKSKYENQITNMHKLPFEIYHEFTMNLDDLTINNRWKELELAIKVVKVIRRWYKPYKINTKKKLGGDFFITYFKDSIDTSKYNLCTIGINFYHRKGYTFKTFILWADKLCKLGLISNDKFNNFMEVLERNSNNG